MGDEAYVYGKAFPRSGGYGLVVSRDQDTPLFVVSDRSEKYLVRETGWNVIVYLALGAVIAVRGFAGLVQASGIVT